MYDEKAGDLNKHIMPDKNDLKNNFILQQNMVKQKLKGPARKFELFKNSSYPKVLQL